MRQLTHLLLGAASMLCPGVGQAITLHIEPVDTDPIVAVGERVEFGLYAELGDDESMEALQWGFDVSSVGDDFSYTSAPRSTWSLITTVAHGGRSDVLMVHAANAFTTGAITNTLLGSLVETGALSDLRVPLGGFSVTAAEEGPIALITEQWVGIDYPLDSPILDTGVCVSSTAVCVGELPAPPPPPEPLPAPAEAPPDVPAPAPAPTPNPGPVGSEDPLPDVPPLSQWLADLEGGPYQLELIDGFLVLVGAEGQVLAREDLPRGWRVARLMPREHVIFLDGGSPVSLAGVADTPEPGIPMLLVVAVLGLLASRRVLSNQACPPD